MKRAFGVTNIACGVTWGERKRPRLFDACAIALCAALMGMTYNQ